MLSHFPRNLTKTIAVSFLAVLCIFSVAALQIPQLKKLQPGAQASSPAELQAEVQSDKNQLNLMQKLPAFGFDNWLADWEFMGFLQYFGDDDARAITGYELSPDYFEVIINHDPRFLDAYRFLSTSGTIYAGMPERSVAIMNQGVKSLSPKNPPKSYYVWRQKGIDELLFLGDTKAAIRSFEKAAAWASGYPDARSKLIADNSRQMVKYLASNPNSKLAQINAWAMVLTSRVDKRTQQIAIQHMQALGAKVSVKEGKLQIHLPSED